MKKNWGEEPEYIHVCCAGKGIDNGIKSIACARNKLDIGSHSSPFNTLE